MQYIENKTFDEIQPGDNAELVRTLTRQDIQSFAKVTGDVNPAHLDEEYARTDIFHKVVGHGMWTASLFSALLGTKLPGPGTIYLKHTLQFHHPVAIGDRVTAKVIVKSKDSSHHHMVLETLCFNDKQECVLSGEAVIIAPTEKIKRPLLFPIESTENTYSALLLQKAKGLAPLKTAVVHPADAYSLQGAVAAAKRGLIEPILVGPEAKIRNIAAEEKLDISPYTLISTPHSHAAAEQAVALVREGKVEALMKGKLHTDELMEAVVHKEQGLRTGRRMSHVFILEFPHYSKPLLLTDAALNIKPTLMEKRDIIQNAIDVFNTLEMGNPRVAILSATEMVTERLPSTLDATALCKMAERGQITGGILDGPLALDNALSSEAATIKGITSPVAGRADILVVPDLEAGNMLYKQARFLSDNDGAGIVVGARVPIILTSRASGAESREASCALALIYTRRNPIV